MEKVSGIYRIVCVKNGRYYYGSAKNVHRRWGAHKRQLINKNHHNQVVQRTWNKYGEESFRFELVEDKLFDVEDGYLAAHVGKSNCMNMSRIARCPSLYGNDNPAKRPDVRKKISEALKGHKISDETKEKIRTSKVGQVISDEVRRKISVTKTGKPNLGRRGKTPWNKGKKRSEKTKDKIRKTLLEYYKE